MTDNAFVRSFVIDMSDPYAMPEKADSWNQLIYSSHGVVSVHRTAGTWVVPPQRAVWLPAGMRHRVELHQGVSLRTLHLHSSITAADSLKCGVVTVTPLLRELILHGVSRCPLFPDKPQDVRLVGVLVDQIEVAATAALELPSLSDERAARVAEILRRNPGDRRSLRELSAEIGASSRTIERVFQSQARMPFAQWRRQCRLLHAMQYLAAGEPVANVAIRVGYENTSSFITMFRAAFGTTPGAFFKDPA